MLFIRRGPGLLFLRTEVPGDVASFFTEVYGGEEKGFMEALTEAHEAQSLIFITAPGLERTCVSDASVIIHSELSTSVILTLLFQQDMQKKVVSAHLGPGIILLRVIGSSEEVKKELHNEYLVRELAIDTAIREGESEDTILLLSGNSLTRPLSRDDIISSPLLISNPVHLLYMKLRARGVYFITAGADNKVWNELRINIYDAADHYEVHYKRLMIALSDLDIGLVLGEMWTKDHALALLSVLAYQVRLFTLEKPERIKRILMALEYNAYGKRFVDMDVYYRNRKLNKNDKAVRMQKGQERVDLRRDLFSRLSEKTREELNTLEKELE